MLQTWFVACYSLLYRWFSLYLTSVDLLEICGQPCTKHVVGPAFARVCTVAQLRECSHFPVHIPVLISRLSVMMVWKLRTLSQQPGNNAKPLCSCRYHFFSLSPLLPTMPTLSTSISSRHTLLVRPPCGESCNPSFTRVYLFLYVPTLLLDSR